MSTCGFWRKSADSDLRVGDPDVNGVVPRVGEGQLHCHQQH